MKKKLLVVHPALAPYRVDFFNSLDAAFDASFYFEFGNPLEQDFDQQKLQSRITFCPHFLKPGFGGIKNLRLDVWGILRKEKPDIVCISEYNILGLLVVLYKIVTNSHFRIITICDDNVLMASSAGFIKRLTRGVLLRFLHSVVLTNEETVRWYKQRWGELCRWICFPIIQSEDIFRSMLQEALPLSVSYREKYRLVGKKVIFYVGRLTEVKNISLLLRVYREVIKVEKNTLLLLVGDGPLWDVLHVETRQLGIDDSVVFAGKQEGLDLMAHYNLGDLFVLPSSYEPFGAVVNEALLAGCYVLCSNNAGAACLIRDKVNGELFDIENEKGLLDKLLVWLSSVSVGTKERESRCNQMLISYKEQFAFLEKELKDSLVHTKNMQ